MKRHLSFLALFFLFFMAVAPVQGGTAKVKVVTSLFPTYDFARQIGGELLDVSLLLPPGVEAHGFAPTPRDMIAINQADLFLYTGAAMEPWAADLLKGVDNKGLLVIDTSAGLLADHGDGHEEVHQQAHHEETTHHHDDHHDHHDEAGHHHEHDDDHHHARGVDPHFWLDPLKAQQMVQTIVEALIKADPANRPTYQARAKAYTAEIARLDEDIRKSLSHCRLHTIISGGHFAFGHFCERYHLETVSAYKGFSPDAKPSPRAITELIETMKRLGSKVVFHEELIQPKVAKIIAEETGARLLLLHGAHNTSKEERQSGETYLSIMRGNLARLQQGLQCQ